MLKVGQKVKCNGYDGTVTRVCDGQLEGMVEVRAPGGITCVSASEVVRFTPWLVNSPEGRAYLKARAELAARII